MQTYPGRNDPCPCGSGKKYKHCHQQEGHGPTELSPRPSAARESEGAVSSALDWLTERHRKGFKVAVETLFEDLWPDDAPGDRKTLGAEVLQSVQINLVEWLIAEGEMQVKGQQRRINAVLTGPDGPRLSDGQRRWLAQQGERALRLYTVTDVRPGDGLTICDASDADAPLAVQERTASWQAQPGLLIGARVMQAGDHLELSGAIYPFSMLAQQGERALRLYTVTEVRPGEGLTLCDAADADAPPLVVQERTASRQAKPDRKSVV